MEDDYKTRMIEEYHELKERISKLDDAVTRYKRGELEFNPKCLGGMTVAQLYIMQDYLHVLFDRIKAMGISLDSDDVEPEEKPLPPEPHRMASSSHATARHTWFSMTRTAHGHTW